jgi:hypothetical protein
MLFSKQNAVFWVAVIVIIAALGGVLYLTRDTQSNTYSPTTTNTATSTVASTTTKSTGTNATGGKPIVVTSEFASVSSTTAVVAGTVMPNGVNTTYWFQYGSTMSYGSYGATVTATGSYKTLGAAGYLTGLKPHTSYYFRITAKNAYGQVYGTQYNFTTAAN